MNPKLIQIGLFIIEQLIGQSPQIVADLQNLFNKGNPTPEDWAALRARVQARSYSSYVPDSALVDAPAPQAAEPERLPQAIEPPQAQAPTPAAAPAPTLTDPPVTPGAQTPSATPTPALLEEAVLRVLESPGTPVALAAEPATGYGAV